VDGLWIPKSEDVGLIVCAISFQDFQTVLVIHQRYRRSDGPMTCNRSTALFTIVHRAVKSHAVQCCLVTHRCSERAYSDDSHSWKYDRSSSTVTTVVPCAPARHWSTRDNSSCPLCSSPLCSLCTLATVVARNGDNLSPFSATIVASVDEALQVRTGGRCCMDALHMQRAHWPQCHGSNFLREIMSWPISWNGDVTSEIRLCQSMHIYFKNNTAEFYPGLIWNEPLYNPPDEQQDELQYDISSWSNQDEWTIDQQLAHAAA